MKEVKKAERANKIQKDGKPLVDKFMEQSIIVKALRSNMLSKLVRTDVQRFQGLISDVFLDQEKEMVFFLYCILH